MTFEQMELADWPASALPANLVRAVSDPARREVLGKLGVLGNEGDADLDGLTGLATTVFQASTALINLIDVNRQWCKSSVGVPVGGGMSAVYLFCAHVVASADGTFAVSDMREDRRFRRATGHDNLRFCAGASLIVDGARIGALCVISDKPREKPDEVELARLKQLAALASSFLALKDSSRRGSIAAAALTRVEKRHKLALEAATIASWIWDVKTGIVECDPLLPELFGLPPATRLRARQLFFAIDRRDLRQAARELDNTLETSADYTGEYRVKGTSPSRWLSTRGRVIERDGEGRPSLVIGVSYDISHRKWTEESQRLLLRELNHRVKNTLATVQALASQTVRHAQNPREFLDAFSARLHSLGRAHGLLSDYEWRGISLEELVRQQIQPFDDVARPRVHVAGPAVWLTPDQALALGLVLHELASNALRHGALSVPGGVVDATWQILGQVEQRRVVLVWRESQGPAVAEPERRGFGSILIRRSLDKILASNVKHEFRPGGVRAEITLPLEAAAS